LLYTLYEMSRAAVAPWRAAAAATGRFYGSPLNPMFYTPVGRTMTAAAELFERVTRRYGKPEWDIHSTMVGKREVPVVPRAVLMKPWMKLTWFERDADALRIARGGDTAPQPKLLLVAPLSGHYATLLRDTASAFLPDFEVFVTEWEDARMVPVADGRFDLDDYTDYVREALELLGPQAHVAAVCQPGPPVLAAVALMAEDGSLAAPASMILMGSPIDTRRSPTVPNQLAGQRPLGWFKDNMIHTVPPPYPGALRRVYPGFLQLMSFMNMNWDRHVDAHWSFFEHLVQGDGEDAAKHREFYDEYLSVLDLTEEFYLQTIDDVFKEHKLARGIATHRGRPIRPEAITKTALMTVEGERDDISGVGQTEATHRLLTGLPDDRKVHYLQRGVGHYGVFNGARFRSEIAPRIADFIQSHRLRSSPVKRVAARLVSSRRKAS
jgi:poly(3-hydroxybutyrate) depolymerase